MRMVIFDKKISRGKIWAQLRCVYKIERKK
jgi:hypothetical protein